MLPHGSQHRDGSLPLIRSTLVLLAIATVGLPIVAAADELRTAAVISGIAHAADGDDVAFGKVRIRLQGIAAPEDSSRSREQGGAEATLNLQKLIDGKFVVCHLDGETAGRGGRPSGVCYVDGRDVGLMQVEQGYARDCPGFSGGRYAAAEQRAIHKGLVLQATYEAPSYCKAE